MKNLLFAITLVLLSPALLVADEPQALNPFGQQPAEREDARQATIKTSDGQTYTGMAYLTRDMRLKIYDEKTKRQREIPLRVVKRIDANVKWERMEKEWQFKELAADKKLYSDKEYPAREFTHTITLNDGRKITGPISAIIYQKIKQTDGEPPIEKRFLLHKRQKGEPGTTLKKLIYVESVDFTEKPSQK